LSGPWLFDPRRLRAGMRLVPKYIHGQPDRDKLCQATLSSPYRAKKATKLPASYPLFLGSALVSSTGHRRATAFNTSPFFVFPCIWGDTLLGANLPLVALLATSSDRLVASTRSFCPVFRSVITHIARAPPRITRAP
jgi:hypothetical protein